MKKIFLFCLLITLPDVIVAQQPTEEEKILIISRLDSIENGKDLIALYEIVKYDIQEAVPLIEQKIFQRVIDNWDRYLNVLLHFRSPNFTSVLKQMIDSADVYCNSDIQFSKFKDISYIPPVGIRVMATKYFFELGNYSTAKYALEAVRQREYTFGFTDGLLLLEKVILYVPQYADSAKMELSRIILSDPFHLTRCKAMSILKETHSIEGIPAIVQMARTDSNESLRYLALEALCDLKYSDLQNILMERLYNEPIIVYRWEIAQLFLTRIGNPEAYNIVKNYLATEQDKVNRLLTKKNLENFIPPKNDSLLTMSQLIDSLGLYVSKIESYNWLGNQTYTVDLNNHIIAAKNNYNAGNQIDCARQIKLFQQAVDREYRDTANMTPAFVTTEGWKFLYYNAQYILDRLPQIPPDGCNVKLVNSTGTKLTGGTLQYYDGAWKDAVNNNDGTFFVNTTKTSLSLRMTYEYGTQTKSNIDLGIDTVAFQTVNAQIQLQNSSGVLIDTGNVQYYAGAWRTFGTTTNGIASKELLPAHYSFRMIYAYASKDKQQDLSINPTVVFQTVNTTVQLQDSHGTLIDQGTVQYYSGAWRSFGTTVNGGATKELLPNNYSFRMTYAYASKDKQQDLNANPTVVFRTVNAYVQLRKSQGALIDQGSVQYYSGAWRAFGTTVSGTTSKELLPNNYSFRMTYEYVSIDKAQDLSTNSTVSFSTVLCTMKAINSQNQPVENATASYYSGAWRQIGYTVNGQITKELLPVNLSFRIKYGSQQKDKQQNLLTNNIVEFIIP